MKVKSESEVAESCLTPSDPMDYRLSGSSIHGIFQARVLEWDAIAFSKRLLERSFRGTSLQRTIRQEVSSCPTCQLNNPQGAQRPQLAQPVQQLGTYPGEDWQMDFTQMPFSQVYKHLLGMIDTFTGWIEGFPTWTEKAEEVVKKTAP